MQEVPTKEVSKARSVSIAEMLSMADSYDITMMVVGSLGAVTTGIMLPISNVLFGQIMDELNEDPDGFQEAINKICIAFVIVGGISMISGYLQVAYWTTAGERQAQKFREKYVHAILSQEVGWFDEVGPSILSTQVAELVGKIQDGMGRKLGDFIFNIVQFAASIIVSFYLSWKLSLVLLASIPVVMGSGYYVVTTVTSAQQQALEQYSRAGGLASQTLNAIRTVNALNVQPGIISKYRQYIYDAMLVGIRKGVNVGLGNGVLYAALFFTNALCYWYGGQLVADAVERSCFSDRCVSGGDVMAVFFCLLMGSMALGQAVPPLSAASTARMAIGNILDLLEREPVINSMSTDGIKPNVKCQGEIVITELEFAYPTRPNLRVCNNYSLRIETGQTVALVGPSGCGKSTVINLLLRFYDPLSGSITMDGFNVRDLNIQWLRSQLGYVGQEPILFAGSIAENIAYGLLGEEGITSEALSSQRLSDRDGAPRVKSPNGDIMARVMDAARMANAHDFISSLPQGYNTDVGSNGMLLSGGQKQRIAIARALIKRPAVLLLDEATSALDAVSERVVQESIDILARSKSQTIIIIAHRLSTIRNADKICVFSEGKIAEMGRHEELLAKNGLYADLVRVQMGDPSPSDERAVVAAPAETVVKAEAVVTEKDSVDDSKAGDIELAVVAGDAKKSEKKEEVKEAKEEVSKERSTALSRRIWGLVWRYPVWFGCGFLGAVLSGGVFPLWGYVLSVTQKNFYLSDPDDIREESNFWGLIYFLFGVSCFFASILEYGGLLGMGEKISIYLRSEMFESLLRRELSFFDDEKNNVGALTTALADDCRLLNKAFSESFARQMQAIGNLALSLGLSFAASWKITLVVLATFPLVVASSAVQMQAVTASQYEDVDEASQDKAGAAKQAKTVKPEEQKELQLKPKGTMSVAGGPGAILSTACTHIRTVSAFSMHHHLAEQYSAITRERAQGRIQRSVYGGLGFGGSNAIQFFIYALLFWYGAILMREDGLSFVDLMIAIFALMMGALGLGQALSDMGDQKQAFLAADRIFRSIDEAKASAIDGLSTAGITPAPAAPGTRRGRIELRNVSFRYPTRPDVPVCNNYNLTIDPGETVALVGPSGSGKSTIINLLLRFYDPKQGSILFDGVDIKELNVRWLRGQMGYVGQEPVLFPGSVQDNVANGRNANIHEPVLTLEQAVEEVERQPGRENATLKALLPCLPEKPAAVETVRRQDADVDVLEACAASHAHTFIETFPQRYGTDVGEGSIMVSGGQKQRIAIAGALVKHPTVLLLDEATSALDANSERLVQQSIDSLSQQQSKPTTIIVAHRLTTIRNADKICVVDRGNIVEVGRHEELLQRPDGLYRQLWEKQQHATAKA